MSEERDAAFMSTGLLRAALQSLENADPKCTEAREHWHEAIKHARKAMLRQWDYAIEADDSPSPARTTEAKAKAAYEAYANRTPTAARNSPSWDTLSDRAQQSWRDQVGSALSAPNNVTGE